MRLPQRECENQFPGGVLGALTVSLSGGALVCQICLIQRWEQVRQGGEEEARPDGDHYESEEEGGRAP